jgi:DegV family protein with EDD domain
MQNHELAITTDSATDVPRKIAIRLGLDGTVPTSITLDGKSILFPNEADWSTLLPLLIQARETGTGAVSPKYYQQVWEAITPERKILSIHIASKLSSVHANAQTAASEIGDRVTVFDTGLVSMAAGFQVIQALEMRNQGAEIPEILHVLNDMRKRTIAFVLAPTTEYFNKSGRISNAANTLGMIIGIKPIAVHFDQQILILDKTNRTFGRALSRIIQLIAQLKHANPIQQMAILDLDNEQKAKELATSLAGFSQTSVIRSEVSPVIGAHIGPGGIGVICITESPLDLSQYLPHR